MSDMSYNFTGIESGAGAIQGSVEAWGGSGSEAYQAVQANWDNTSTELNEALKALALRIGEAGQSMQQTESGVTGMFT